MKLTKEEYVSKRLDYSIKSRITKLKELANREKDKFYANETKLNLIRINLKEDIYVTKHRNLLKKEYCKLTKENIEVLNGFAFNLDPEIVKIEKYVRDTFTKDYEVLFDEYSNNPNSMSVLDRSLTINEVNLTSITYGSSYEDDYY